MPLRSFLRFSTFAVLMIAASSAAGLFAQTPTATLYGNVHDQTGGVLVGATIELLQVDTGLKRSIKSDSIGQFAIPSLSNGRYTLTTSQTGFKASVIRDINLEVGQKSTLDILLVPGLRDEHVDVVADANTLQAVNGGGKEVFDNLTINSLPQSTRGFLPLATLAPGVAPAAPGSDLSNQVGGAVNVNGARESSNNFLLDGIDNNDLFLNNYVINPSIDSIQEFTVLSNNYDAEYGRNSGGQILVVTKSGGQEFHGSFYEFFRHSGMNAKNFFDRPNEDTPHLRRNLFGGTVGGPFIGSHNFFFLNGEFDRAQQADTRTTNVPTLLETKGNFSASSVTIRDPFTGLPFPGNQIPTNRLDAIGTRLAALFPAPNRSAVGQNYVTSPLDIDRIGQLNTKVDLNSSPANPIFLKYTYNNDNNQSPFSSGGPNLPGFGTSNLNRAQELGIGFTHFFSSQSVNEFRLGYSRLRRDVSPQNNTNALQALGAQAPALPVDDLGYPKIQISGYESLGDDPNIPTKARRETIHFSDSLSFTRGRHHMKTGVELRHYLSNGYTHLFSRGQLLFTGALTGNGLADLLLGYPTVGIVANNNNYQSIRTHSVNTFFEDDLKLTSTLGVNLGVRYEYNSPPVDAHDTVSIFDLQKLTIRPVGKNGVSRSGLKSDFNNFAPRVGLTWDPNHGRLVVRTGYGVFYDTHALISNSALYYNPPVFDLKLFFTGTTPLQLNNPFPTGSGFSPAPSPVTVDPNIRTGYAQQWNLNLESNVRKNLIVQASYVGTKGTKLQMKRNINQPLPGAGNVDARRPIAGFSDIVVVGSGAASIYHSLQLKVERKTTNGLSLLGSYTLSKSIDNTSEFIASSGDDNTPQNNRSVGLDRGLSNFDVRNQLTAAATYDLPKLMDNILTRGWRLSAILSLHGGRPFTPRLITDNSNTGNGSSINGHDRPNLVGDPKLSNPTPDRFFNTAAFAMPAPFTFGNAGRNILTGPGFANLDMALARDLMSVRHTKVQLRGEVFNVLNHPNFQNPDSYLDKPTFGKVLAAYSSRQVQLNMKVVF